MHVGDRVLHCHLHIYTRWLYIYMYVYRTQYLWKVRTSTYACVELVFDIDCPMFVHRT